MNNLFFKIVLIILLKLSCLEKSYTQKSPIDKGSTILSGNLAFSSLGGDLYSYNGKRILLLQFFPSVNYFVMPRLSVGGKFIFAGARLEGSKPNKDNSYMVGGGPQILYFLGKIHSDSSKIQKIYPYFGFGFIYTHTKTQQFFQGYSMGNYNSIVVYSGIGLCAMITKSVGLTGELVYNFDYTTFRNVSSNKGHIIHTDFGFIIFLY